MKLTKLYNGAGVYSDDDRTQLVKRDMPHRDGHGDTLYGHLDNLEESLGEMRSRGDNIVRFALGTLGTHLSLTSPNLPSIAQDPLTRTQAILSPFAAEWRDAEARDLESRVKKKVYVECRLLPGR